jgi:ferritin-like metal-binding protein YciE
MATATERISRLLLDAHAVEKQAKTMLDALARRIENYPDVKEQIERHFREGRERAAALQGYVDRHADATPNWKDSTGQSVAMGQGLSGAFVGDKFVKRAMIEIML